VPDGSVRPGYSPVAEAFIGGLEVGVYVALAVISVLIVAATVRRVLGAV
jgi:hypothetical protein